MKKPIRECCGRVMGIDLGDRYRYVVAIQPTGEVEFERRIRTREEALRKLASFPGLQRVALEAGTHSPWVGPLFEQAGIETFVANGRKLRLIYENKKKSDRMDAEYLARLVRRDPRLLAPIEPKDRQYQEDWQVLKLRDEMVRVRACLVVQVRGLMKNRGQSLPRCTPAGFPKKVAEALRGPEREMLLPTLKVIHEASVQIRRYDRQVEQLNRQRYPQTALLRQIKGVGPVTALAFVLVIGDPQRFVQARKVGGYLGLCPAQDESGNRSLQLRISKEGNPLLRRLLVNCAHYILGPFGQECQLRQQGLRICERGGKHARKRAAVAVARKLAVVMLTLMQTGQVYEPFPAHHQEAA